MTGTEISHSQVTPDGPQDIGTLHTLQLAGLGDGPVWATATATLANGTVVVAAGGSNGRIAWWNGVSGELLSDAMSADPVVVRAMTAVTLPDGRIRFATAGSRGTVQVWDGAKGVTTGEPISSATGPVWSLAALMLPEPAAVLFAGGDDGLIHRWDLETCEPVGEPFGAYGGAVRAMTTGVPINGRTTLVAGGDDGIARCWDAETGQQIGPSMHSDSGAIWGLTVAKLPSGSSVVVSSNNNGAFTRWDHTGERMGGPITVGPGSLTSVVAVPLADGSVGLICGGTDGRLSCWDVRTGEPVGHAVQVSDRGVFSLATVPEVDGRVRLAFGTDGTVTVAPVIWDSLPRLSAPAQVDSTRVRDGLGRRVLAAHLGALLGELAADSESTSAVVHIDGQWGAGKSTLVRLLLDDKQGHGPKWVSPLVVDYEAWRECAIAPEWWSLVVAIEKEVRRSRSRVVQAFMHLGSVVSRTVQSPATLTALAIAVLGGLVSMFLPSSWAQTLATIAAVIGGMVGIGQVAGRTLFWHSAPMGRLHLQMEDNPLGQVADMVSWLRGWAPRMPRDKAGQKSRQPILLVIDDLDRCPAERVVKILETVHTILRQPRARIREPARLFVLVLADGRWVRHAYESRFAEFQNPESATRDIGSDFTQKVFDHVVLVPDLFAEQVSTYLDGVVGVPTDRETVSADSTTVRTPNDRSGHRKGQTVPGAGPPVRDEEAVRINHALHEATAAATEVRRHHLLHTYANLMPANPRLIKRIANALGMLVAIRLHVRHTEDDDAMARAAILLVRFPMLAARLRLDDMPNCADPCWDLPDVRDVLGERSLESLARCLGRASWPDMAD